MARTLPEGTASGSEPQADGEAGRALAVALAVGPVFRGRGHRWEWGLGEAQAQPSQRRGPRACPDMPARCGVCWRPVGRPLPPSAAFLPGGPEPLRGAPRRAPRAPRRRVRPACRRARPRPSAQRHAFPFSGKTGPVFRGRGHTGPTLGWVVG